MTLTNKQLKGYVQLAVGGDPSTTPSITADERVAQIINHAGEHLYTRAWRFRERTAKDLGTTASQSYITLPSDVGEIITVEPVNSWSNSLSFVDPATFERVSNEGVSPELSYLVTLVYKDNNPTLDIYPTPAATDADAFQIRYRARWVELTIPTGANSVDDTTAVGVATYVEGLLIEYVRAIAEGGEDGTTQQRLMEVDNGIMLDRALRKDGTLQPDYGSLPSSRYSGGQSYAAGTVSAPTATTILWRGTWSASNLYTVNDLVHYTGNGNSYICILDTTASGEVPTNASYWDIFTAS
jgi:hypothetical protein